MIEVASVGIALISIAVVAFAGFFLAGFLFKVRLRRMYVKACATHRNPGEPGDLASFPRSLIHPH